MNKVRWGFIGCGDVTEMKSGPAFHKVPNSQVIAVMSRNPDKAADYALRHNIPHWFSKAEDILTHPGIDAVYIATPPSSHLEYAKRAIESGKCVYVEKPVTLNADEATRLASIIQENEGRLSIAHYRRRQPKFQKIKQILESGAIGRVLSAQLEFTRPALSIDAVSRPGTAWRLQPFISGGGLFHDLAPHQLDLAHYFFGPSIAAKGHAIHSSNLYYADDVVTGIIQFESGTLFSGLWNFSGGEAESNDSFKIIGSEGTVQFSVFDAQTFTLTLSNAVEEFRFEALQHVQQPMIEAVTRYFLGTDRNPCSINEGLAVMQLMDAFTK